MKLISWNVNGLRAAIGKGFTDIIKTADADFFCIQEIKLQEGQLDLEIPGYHAYYSYADRKGYSGTAIFARRKPLRAFTVIECDNEDVDIHNHEGRIVALEYDSFYLVNVYVPNSQNELARLDYRMEWDRVFRNFLCRLDADKPVIICGDFKVAHQEIDLANPKTNRRNAGFTDEERAGFTELLRSGFSDSFRELHPDQKGAYSWWSYRGRAREKNVGWRIDYFLVSKRLMPKVSDATIHPDITGSDHCPVRLCINLYYYLIAAFRGLRWTSVTIR